MKNNKKTQLKDQLQIRPWEYSLHQLLAILELLNPNAAEFGSGRQAKDEPAMLKAYCTFAVPSSDCVEYKETKEDKALTINQTALVGMNSVLPQIYSERIISQIKERNLHVIDFLNIFHQRFFGLAHKIEKKTEINLNRNAFEAFEYPKAIAGIAEKKTNQKAQKQPFHKKMLPCMAAIMWNKHRNALGLKTILQALFPNFQIEIQQFLPTWFKIDHDSKTRLNRQPLNNKTLGMEAVSIQFAIKLIISLNSKEDYDSVLPGNKYSDLIKQVTEYYCPPGFKIKYETKLPIKEKSLCSLGKNQKLGYNTWLRDYSPIANPNELSFGCSFE